MNSDSIHSAAISMASSNPKDFGKKKKVNRSARLKQCKLDARREQWLSQVKRKEVVKNEMNEGWGTCGGHAEKERSHLTDKLEIRSRVHETFSDGLSTQQCYDTRHVEKERSHLMDKLEIRSRGHEESFSNGLSTQQCSDTDSSPANSPLSHISELRSNHSGITFTACSGSCSSRSSSISSNGCSWGIMSEEDDGNAVDDGCLDDWEAVADALAVIDKIKLKHVPDSELVSPLLEERGNSVESSSPLETIHGIYNTSTSSESRETAQGPPANYWTLKPRIQYQCNKALTDSNKMKIKDSPDSVLPPSDKHGNHMQSSSELETSQEFDNLDVNAERRETAPRPPFNFCAWRADDAFRPQSLPNLSKQFSLPSNPGRHINHEVSVWGCKNLRPTATSCPICCEDLDCTDSSFTPCLCGFRLCLFCHKRIMEEDGRCPGCRKEYDHVPVKGEAPFEAGSLTCHFTRSWSMITRF